MWVITARVYRRFVASANSGVKYDNGNLGSREGGGGDGKREGDGMLYCGAEVMGTEQD